MALADSFQRIMNSPGFQHAVIERLEAQKAGLLRKQRIATLMRENRQLEKANSPSGSAAKVLQLVWENKEQIAEAAVVAAQLLKGLQGRRTKG